MKKLIWLVVSLLMMLSLVLASCGQTTTTETESPGIKVTTQQGQSTSGGTETSGGTTGSETTGGTTEEVEQGTGLQSPETPKYGGRLYAAVNQDPMGWDHGYVMFPGLSNAEDELLTGDWAKGPAGTGEMSWTIGNNGRLDVLTGNLAESWELVGDDTIIFHIRHGVHFWDKAPANGREMTAEDVAWNIERQWKSDGTTFLKMTNAPADRLISATAIDKYTVELKVPPQVQGLQLFLNGERVGINAPEVVDEYGSYQDWRVVVTTGPFMLTDFVSGSAITFDKNPNYWKEDPLNPGNQLPYVDGVTHLIIQDESTRLAAFRTGKIDFWLGLSWDNWNQTQDLHPEMEALQTFSSATPNIIGMRTDKTELPFADIRVRKAMNLAIDREALVNDYWGGHAELFSWPYLPIPDHSNLYTPLADLSAEAQEMETYNPDKAKELLAEAGYPNGFKTSIDLPTQYGDFLSIIKEYFAAVGIDMELIISEPGKFTSINRGRTHEEMIFKEPKMWAFSWKMHEVRPESMDDTSYWGDDETRAVYETLNQYLAKDDAKWQAALKGVTSHILEQAPYVFLPSPYTFNVWWPWLQNWYGASDVGYFTPGVWYQYIWLDTVMKKQMGY